MKSDRGFLILGIIIGLLSPPFALWLYRVFNLPDLEFQVFISRLLYTTLFAPFLSLAVIINLLMFFIFIWIDRDEGAKGVLFSTLLYAFVVLWFKLF